jgi:S-formylglutathione hydrolase FrmB
MGQATGSERARRTRQRTIRRRRRVAVIVAGLLLAAVGFGVVHAVLAVDTHGAHVDHLTIESQAVDRSEKVNVVIPKDAGNAPARPLLVFLHGRSGSESSYTHDEAFFSALAKLGDRAPIVAFPDGGVDSYWHNRRDGRWGTYVMREVIPKVLAATGADRRRIAIGGISMGGFGAYDLALAHRDRFCAVGGHSPALWLRGGDTAPGAFDDAEDFARHDVIAQVRSDPGAFGEVPIWNDAGKQDPFGISDLAFDEALDSGGADLTTHRWSGGHELAYWDRHWLAYLRFYARALASCD